MHRQLSKFHPNQFLLGVYDMMGKVCTYITQKTLKRQIPIMYAVNAARLTRP
jgi:hypothetical protein